MPTDGSGCNRTGIDCFAGDLTDEEKELTWATAMAPAADMFDQKRRGRRLEDEAELVHRRLTTTVPSTPISSVCANRMGATTYEVDSSHVPMLSHPELVLDVIRQAASAVQESTPAAV